MEKITNKSAIQFVLANYDLPTEYVEKFNAMLIALDKKASAPRNPSADVIANKALRSAILDAMVEGKLYSINDLIALVPELATASSHKVSALLTPMKREGLVVREEVKRKAYFRKA